MDLLPKRTIIAGFNGDAPESVVNRAAYTAAGTAECHQERAIGPNATAAAAIATSSKAQGVFLIHFSSG